jgi:hypothetical protein
MNKAKSIVSLLGALLLMNSSIAVAQEAEAADELPRYQVELLVFRNLDQSTTTTEIPRMPEAEIADILDQDLLSAEPAAIATSPTDAEAAEAISEDQYWIEAAPEQYRLADVASRLERLQAYDLLLHLGWQQAAPDVSEAPELDFALLGVDPALVSGTAKLFSRRYLHLALDVELDDGAGLQTYPAINDSRRIRLEELHYFDQPQLGIIAMVSRVEEPPE